MMMTTARRKSTGRTVLLIEARFYVTPASEEREDGGRNTKPYYVHLSKCRDDDWAMWGCCGCCGTSLFVAEEDLVVVVQR